MDTFVLAVWMTCFSSAFVVCACHEASTALLLVFFPSQQCVHCCGLPGRHQTLHHHSEYCTKWVQFWVNEPFWHWISEDNNPQCVADVGGEGRGGWKGLCCCCLSALWGYRLWLCKSAGVSTLCQFVPLCFWAFRRPWLWLWVQPVPACLKSEWVFVGDQTRPLHPCDPSRRPKGWAWPRALHPLQKKWKKKKKSDFFPFLFRALESPLPVSSSESKWDEPVLPHSERDSEKETHFLFLKFLRLSWSFLVVWTFPLPF